MSTWVLKFSQIDKPDQPILVHISSRNAEKDLDLDLLGTDGDAAYRSKMREKSLKKLRADNYDGTEEDWKQLLRYVLVSRADTTLPKSLSNSLETDCVFSGKGLKRVLSITIRTKVEDITHKLGSIELNHSDDTDDVDLFGWACQAVEQRDDLTAQLQADGVKLKSSKDRVKVLEQQLEELIRSKEDHENELLSKFALLLNEKKLHIRTQQQQIAQQGSPPLAARSSTFKKRKQSERHEDGDEDQSDESDAFEAMDVDEDIHAEVEDDKERDEIDRQSTPSRASSTDSDDENDLDRTTMLRSPAGGTGQQRLGSDSKSKLLAVGTKNSGDKLEKSSNTPTVDSRAQDDTKDQPITRSMKQATDENDDESTASEDDEL